MLNIRGREVQFVGAAIMLLGFVLPWFRVDSMTQPTTLGYISVTTGGLHSIILLMVIASLLLVSLLFKPTHKKTKRVRFYIRLVAGVLGLIIVIAEIFYFIPSVHVPQLLSSLELGSGTPAMMIGIAPFLGGVLIYTLGAAWEMYIYAT